MSIGMPPHPTLSRQGKGKHDDVKMNSLPLAGGRYEKIGIHPLTLPSPRGGEGNPVEMKMKFPPP